MSFQEQVDREHRRMRRGVRLVTVKRVVEEALADLISPLFEGDASLVALPVSELDVELPAPGGDRLSFLALFRSERFDSGVVYRRCVLLSLLSPQVAGLMVVVHPEFPVAVWIKCEPALADEELQHRPQRSDRLQHLLSIGQRVGRPEKTALPT